MNHQYPTEVKTKAINDTLRRFELSRRRVVMGIPVDDDRDLPTFFRRDEIDPYDGVPALTGLWGE